MSNVIFGTTKKDGLTEVDMLPPQHPSYRLHAFLFELGVWLGLCDDRTLEG